MGKKTDYKRLWRREQKKARALYEMLANLKNINEAQIEVLRRVRDGELKPGEIFQDEKIPGDVKLKEAIKQKKV